MNLSFEKYHGTGNDFVIVNENACVPHRARFARSVCDRAEGIGADGVLFLSLEPNFRPPRVIMTLVQPDGSTAEMCGNGARCAAVWAAKQANADEVMIDTLAGTRHATIHDGGATIEMGAPKFDPNAVPLAGDEPLVESRVGDYDVTAVNTGVPHAVAFVDDVNDVNLEHDAPPIRHADVFPRGANVTFASRCEGGFDQRTFERGVEGETQSCGTGAVAIAAAARRLGLVDGDQVSVSPPGGDLEVTVGDRTATLTGPVEREFGGDMHVSNAGRLDLEA
ncbi:MULTISPECIES: diaminopimelate epimerase [unclassified Haladaptatus]|uniref:diaminopimelate epimerase n=1 Tax=unclassified Haladaptatus TaxID=2622732 RepID=UPI00209BFC5E|nr:MULTISPECIES: diaminopimelate epimerase [unclassified Haladaptatus]MCO8244475.1 diaminopimelate epimerase [Haladaptatus sp. AB643]MCO8253903.1 diaminopimelate epimerase [Haladaptatus sp. AB618]